MIKGLKPKFKITLWAISIAVVLIIGLFYFPRENVNAGFWETFYFTLRLFVFEHDLPTFPKYWPLIFIYFFAPMITISSIGAVISYLFRLTPSIKTRWMSDHVVICGMGRTGRLFACALEEKGVQVVGVDLGRPEDFDEWCDEHRVPVIFGDFNSRAVLQKVGAARARSIIFASGDDLANFEGALSAYEWLQTNNDPVRLIWAQISNEQLANTARVAVRTSGKVGIRFFDTYRIAALKMIAKYFEKNLLSKVSEFNILGFGKFGQDLLDVFIHNLHPDDQISIRVVDKQDRENDVKLIAEELGMAERVSFQRAAIQELDLDAQVKRAFFICTDDDLGNLTTAMSLACDTNVVRIYVRMGHWPLPGVSGNLGEDRGLHFINISDLVIQGIEDLPGIFRPAGISDLKRTKLGGSL